MAFHCTVSPNSGTTAAIPLLSRPGQLPAHHLLPLSIGPPCSPLKYALLQGLWGFPGLVSIRRDPTQRSSRMRKGKSEEQIQTYSGLGGQLVFQVNRHEPAFSFAPPSASACSAAGRARTQLDFCR